MPPKKKKPPSKLDEDDQELVDVFSYVELVQDCLERAEINQKACLEGIIKSDLALRQSQSDADIHFIVLVRRAELLLICVKKCYDTSDLPAAHRNPLKSCINDCERVVARVSAADPISKGIYEQACTILRSAKEIQKAQSSKSAEGKGAGGTFQRYDPTKTLFRNITKINPYLLQDVVNCYRQSKTVCRSCYYKHKSTEALGSTHHCRRCKRTTHPLVLIPASQMCDNLFHAKIVAVPAPPKNHMNRDSKHKPFQMCKKSDHKVCNDKSALGETWFAHSIEELVIWTIERHYDVKFNRYMEVYHQEHDPPDLTLFDGIGIESFKHGSGGGTAHRQGHTTVGELQEGRVYQYYADECVFPSVASIPERLLWDVLNCYKNFKEYCKWCYYEKDERGVIVINRRNNSTMCSNCQQPWESVVVIPASSLCWNFGNFDELPIAPWPKDKPTRDPFEYCRKKDHYRCFRVYIDSFWYPHSVEELVIWTVEREKKCTFRQFMLKAIQLPSPISSPRQTPPPATPNSVPIPITKSAEAKTPPSSYAAAGASPAKKKGPPSPLSLSSHSPPPPSFSSVAAGLSPKKPTSPMLKPNHLPKGGDAAKMAAVENLPQTKAVTVAPSSLRAQPVTSAVFVTGGSLNRGMDGVRPGKLADITGPVDSYEQVGFPFIISHSGDIVNNDIIARSHDHHHQFQVPNVFAQLQTNNNTIMLHQLQQSPVTGGIIKGAVAGGSGINTLAGSSSPIVASVSTRRNYRVASTSTEVHSPSSNSGSIAGAKDNKNSVGVASKLAAPQQMSSPMLVASTSFSQSSHGNNVVFDAGTRPETVALKALFKFTEVDFKIFSDIPHSLLNGIARCFKDKKFVCRRCFYGDRSISHLIHPNNRCSSGDHIWSNPVLVIPGCDLCDNEPLFKQGEHVAVPPLPPVAIIKKCEKRNHHKCFAQSLEADQRFAHSVEELVVWLVESEIECSFEQFVSSNGLLRPTESESFNSVAPPTTLDHQATTFVPQQNGPKITTAPVTLATAAATPPSNVTTTDPSQSQVGGAMGGAISGVMGGYTTDISGKLLYDPKKTEFVNIRDIPVDLLTAVAECFHRRLFVCRICFFESQCTKLISKVETKQMIMCEEGHTPWKQIKVVPRCKLCITPSDHAPIPPLPKHMKNSNIPFAVCKKTEHQTCYAMSRGTNPWFPHTVEELVIWTVERERGIDFEECYKEYLPDHIKSTRSTMDNAPPPQTFPEPHLLISRGPQGMHVAGGPQGVPPLYQTNRSSQNGFKNALDLASLPQSRGHFDYTASSLTQPGPYHSGLAFHGDMRFGGNSSSSQFDFPPPHLTAGGRGGTIPAPAFVGGNNIPVSNLDVEAPSDVNAAGSTFANFFPALLSENPVSNSSNSQAAQEDDIAPSGKSVTDLFNLTAGLDHIPTDFEDPLALGSSNLSHENGAIAANKSGDIEMTWGQQNDAVVTKNSNGGSGVRVNEMNSPFLHGPLGEDRAEANTGEEMTAQSSGGLDRMESFGFNLSTDSNSNTTSSAVTIDNDVNLQESNPSSSAAANAVTAATAVDPNWQNYVTMPNADSYSLASSNEMHASGSNNDGGDLDIPRMPNTQPFVLGRTAQLIGTEQKITNDVRGKSSPKGKKRKKKSGCKSSSYDVSSQNGQEVIKNDVSSQFLDSGSVAKSEGISQEELGHVEELMKRTRASNNLSSNSAPNFSEVNSFTEFRSAGHTPPTPPTVDDVVSDETPSNTATSLEPFADVDDDGENGVLQMGSSDMDVATGAADIEHLLQPLDNEEMGMAAGGKISGRSSLLGSIMAARASKGQEYGTGVELGDTLNDNDASDFKSSPPPPPPPAFAAYDIEDESSQENEDSAAATEEVTPSVLAGKSEVHVSVDDPTISLEDPLLFTEEAAKQDDLINQNADISGDQKVVVSEEPGEGEGEKEMAWRPTDKTTAAAVVEGVHDSATVPNPEIYIVEQVDTKLDAVAPSEPVKVAVPSETVQKKFQESSVDPYPQTITDGLTKRLSEWDLSQSSDDEFDLNIEGEDQTLQHVPIEDWGCTLSDSEN